MWEGCWRPWAAAGLPCSPLVFDLERASRLQNSFTCQVERTPALGQPGWERELRGENRLVSRRLWGCCYCCDSAGRMSLSGGQL